MSRDQILSRVRTALAGLPQRAALPDWDRELVAQRTASSTGDLWALFCERFRAVNGTPFAAPGELFAFLAARGFTHGYCDPALLGQLGQPLPSGLILESTFDRTRVDEYQFGLTAAVGAIAETGTLILSDAATSSRLGALAPWMHIAVFRRDQLLPDLPAALAIMPTDPNVVWITGPSKTADVEGILIEGVHGPGIQAALLVP